MQVLLSHLTIIELSGYWARSRSLIDHFSSKFKSVTLLHNNSKGNTLCHVFTAYRTWPQECGHWWIQQPKLENIENKNSGRSDRMTAQLFCKKTYFTDKHQTTKVYALPMALWTDCRKRNSVVSKWNSVSPVEDSKKKKIVDYKAAT